jgi:hypothetical protein
VTFTGGGTTVNQWINLSAGLDGSAVQAIVTNPLRGSREAYAVTRRGVYHMVDAAAAGAAWVNITGNLFGVPHAPFGDPLLTEARARDLTSIVADWRYVIPDTLTSPPPLNLSDPALTHPILYVAGEGGVYRSTDDGQDLGAVPGARPGGSNPPPTPPTFGPAAACPTPASPTWTWRWATPTRPTAGPTSRPGRTCLVATTYGRAASPSLAPVVFTTCWPSTGQRHPPPAARRPGAPCFHRLSPANPGPSSAASASRRPSATS